MNVLEVKNITKVFKLYKKPSDRLKEIFFKKKYHKEFFANKNISFSLKNGETIGIIGLNGAGKSTLLKQIAGVINPTSGEIIKRGRVTSLLELGTGFDEEFSGRENIYFNGMLIGMSKDEINKKLDDIIEFSELNEFIDEPLKTYSSGMKARLAFSIAIHSDPEILIVDEILSVGDAHFSAKCTKKLKELKEKKLSTIYVSHDLNSLKILCDRVLVLNKGELVFEGDSENAINYYNFLIAKLENDKIEIKNKEYGNFDAIIKEVKIYSKNNTKIFQSGEEVTIEITIKANRDIKNKTIGILIRDKFGIDIFGTNTYYYNKFLTLKQNETKKVYFKLPLNIAPGQYTLTVAIHSQDRHNYECLHWIDNAISFEIQGIKGEMFIGICKLNPKIVIEE